MQAVAAGFKVGIPDVNVRAVDSPAERVIAFHANGVVAAACEIAIVNLDIAAAHQINGVAGFLDDDVVEGDTLAVVEQIAKVAAFLVRDVFEMQILADFDRD